MAWELQPTWVPIEKKPNDAVVVVPWMTKNVMEKEKETNETTFFCLYLYYSYFIYLLN